MIIGLTFDAIVGIISKLEKENFSEPVGSINECDLCKLESTLKTPFLRTEQENKIDDFCEKASILFYLLTENHCFKNSNKRIAVAALITIADINGYKISLTEISLYALAMAVTLLSKYGLVDEAQEEVRSAIKNAISIKSGKLLSFTEKKLLEEEFTLFMQQVNYY